MVPSGKADTRASAADLVNVFRFIPGYEDYVVVPGKEAIFLLLLAFLITFGLARLYTRLGRARGWGSGSVGGVHLHHAVPGVILALGAGVLSFGPWIDEPAMQGVLAIVFGVGAALILDEWALIFHLRDVYWTKEGRSSVDAAIMGCLVTGLLLVTSSPFETGDDSQTPRAAAFTVLAFGYLFAFLTFLKGKPILGILAVAFVPVGIVASIRLAKPSAPWARWFYDPERDKRPRAQARRAAKLARSRERFEHGRIAQLQNAFIDLIGGKPSLSVPDR